MYITFYSLRAGAPLKVRPNHFRFPLTKHTFFQEMVYILRLMETEFPDRHVVVHIGWPLSSWFDRFSMGVMYLRLLRLPWLFPSFGFIMRYMTRVPLPLAKPDQRKKGGNIKPSDHRISDQGPNSPRTKIHTVSMVKLLLEPRLNSYCVRYLLCRGYLPVFPVRRTLGKPHSLPSDPKVTLILIKIGLFRGYEMPPSPSMPPFMSLSLIGWHPQRAKWRAS